MNSLPITSTYAALLGFIFVVITLRIAQQRYAKRVSLGDGGDKQFSKLIRGHGNFTETVPLALILILLLELQGASATLLHVLGAALVIGRVMHYLQLTGTIKPLLFRTVGMVLTITVIIAASVRLLFGM